jgi:hypothetical protein
VVRGNKGHTIIETVIASSMFVILASAGFVGGAAHFREIGRSFDDLAGTKAAASRLEALAADAAMLIEGEHTFDVGRPGMIGLERVTAREPGLYEVLVRVTTEDGRVSGELTTLIAREEPR